MMSNARHLRTGAAVASVMAATLALEPSVAQAARPVPPAAVEGPIASVTPGDPSRNYTFLATPIDLAALGYVEEEFFISGTACRYLVPAAPPGGAPGTAAIRDCGWPYKTRVVVRRPASVEAFNGTVIAEWQNVTAQYDVDHYWLESSEHLMREGYAWVGISVQRAGVQPLPPPASPLISVNTLKAWSPLRYSSLDVTAGGLVLNDDLSYDIFSQAVKALREPASTDPDPLGPLDPSVVIAVGTSQSGGRLSAYHNSIWPLYEPVVSAFFIGESRGVLRTDLPVPVLRLLSEVDVAAAFTPADAPNYRHWEVAGTSHADFGFIGNIQPLLVRDQVVQSTPVCTFNPLSRIPKRYAYNAAWNHMDAWVRAGTLPPVAPRISYSGGVIARDASGNALGGIRLSEHEVATAVNGTGNGGGVFCTLFGLHLPFSQETLASLYRNHGRYVSQVAQVNAANVKAGFLLPADSEESTGNAAESTVGRK